MKRTISSVLALAMVAALLAIFAGAASAQTDTGKGQITAVNGTDKTVTVTAADGTDTIDLGSGLAPGTAGTPATVAPGTYAITFTDDADGTTVVASYQLAVGAVAAWNVVSGFGDPADTNATHAAAYPIDLDAATPVVVFSNSSAVSVTVTPGDLPVDQGAQSGPQTPADFTITTPAGATTNAALSGVDAASYTDAVVVGTDDAPAQVSVTIADLAALKASLESTAPPSDVTVPNVLDTAEADATVAIEGAGLVVGNTTATPDDTIVAGNVISQTPAAGDTVAAGSAVDIVVSTGPDTPATVPVPDVAGKSAADAQAELEAAGFTVTTEEQGSETVEAGLVIETNPSAGTEVAPGTEVKIIVSTGIGDIVVPDFTGMTIDEATAAAEVAGLTITFVEDADDPDPEGIVVSQEPVGGTTVEAGTEVVAQLSPAIDDAWVILTLSPERVLTASGINFEPGSTVDLIVLETDKDAKATVQDDGSWAATADLSDVQNEAELLLVTGTAADGSDYEATFKIPAAGESTDEPTEEVAPVEEESSGVSVWVWILLGLVVVAIVLLGIKMFGGGDTTTDSDDTTGGDDTTGADTN
jgi:beta-lactam-binding protein with PASTA domain